MDLALDGGGQRATIPTTPYDACAERGYLIKNPEGEVYVHRLGNNPMLVGSCIDLTNPEAVAWWQDKIRRLAGMGVSGFNTDFGEQVPEDALFHDGRTGREMHNIYPRLYNETHLRGHADDPAGCAAGAVRLAWLAAAVGHLGRRPDL